VQNLGDSFQISASLFVQTVRRVQRELEEIILIVISIALGNMEFLYIDREDSILCLDQTRQYYFMIDEAKLCHYKTTTTG
jgi:hypothetical protein